MTAANHVITGCALVATVGRPWISLPLAVLMHFVLDALPHYGNRDDARRGLSNLRFVLPIDAAVGLCVLLAVLLTFTEHAWIIALGGVLCASPDLLQIPRYVRFLQTGDTAPMRDWLSRFHAYIQWGERPWGIYIELVWFAAMAFILWAGV